MREVFAKRNVSIDGELIVSCGSGVSAAVVVFCQHLLRERKSEISKIYDGSWSEYGMQLPRLPNGLTKTM